MTPAAPNTRVNLEFLQIPTVSAFSTLPKPPPTETVAIIVQNSIYSSVSAAVTQYRTDLNNSGYNTILYTQALSTAQQVKTLLQGYYNTYTNFVGAVLIGRLPYAQYWHAAGGGFSAETFICDVYLMDLDGDWWDINPTDGVYDKHNASTGDIYPEIFVGRIDPTCLTWGTVAGNINTYLGRLNTYRTGGVQRQRRALTFIDDDWVQWADGTYDNWPAWLNTPYPTRTDHHTPTTETTAAYWLGNITLNYQWAHLCAHSSPTTHFFGPGGTGEGTVTSAQIVSTTPMFNYYNLFCCSGADWSAADNLAVSYLFDGTYSIGVVGTTKTGGMQDGDYFYNPLGQNRTIGESLTDWMGYVFNNAGGDAGSYWLEWYYGMNIVGDPFSSIWYDNTVLPPVISSTTHVSGSWSMTNQAQLNWSVPADVNGIVGYYYILDNSPSTVPTSATGIYTTINGTATGVLSDGARYLHVVAKDGAGNVGTGASAAHFALYIDTTAPVVSITTPTSGATVTGSSAALNWTVVETGSGYYQSQIFLDSAVYGLVTNYSITLTGLLPGAHTVQVVASDNTGTTGSSSVSFTVVATTTPMIPGFPVASIVLGAVLALGLGLVQKRRRGK